MKKLIALLTACTAMTCLFASCGKDEDSKDDTKASDKNSTSVSESADEKEDKDAEKEDETEAETDAEEETEAETEAETEKETKEEKKDDKKDSKKDDKKNDGGSITQEELIGRWISYDESYDGLYLGFDFSDKKGSLIIDFDEMMHFNADGDFSFNGEVMTDEFVKYDGSTFEFSVGGQNMITMVRTGSADASSKDGEYKLTGGLFYDELIPEIQSQFGTDSDEVYFDVEGENMYMIFKDLFEYTLSGDTLNVSGSVAMFGNETDSEDLDVSYDGKTLSLTSAGETLNFVRAE